METLVVDVVFVNSEESLIHHSLISVFGSEIQTFWMSLKNNLVYHPGLLSPNSTVKDLLIFMYLYLNYPVYYVP